MALRCLKIHAQKIKCSSCGAVRCLTERGRRRDGPKPFLNSKAHAFKVNDAYVFTEQEQRMGRYGIPLGLTLFGIYLYFGFIRQYGEKDKGVMEFLTKDISDKMAPHRREKIRDQLEQEKEMLEVQNHKATKDS